MANRHASVVSWKWNRDNLFGEEEDMRKSTTGK